MLQSNGKSRLLDTFSPTAKIAITRFFLYLVAINHWYLEQLDANNAFLYVDLNEEVYMALSPGHPASNINLSKVCELNKSIYGL